MAQPFVFVIIAIYNLQIKLVCIVMISQFSRYEQTTLLLRGITSPSPPPSSPHPWAPDIVFAARDWFKNSINIAVLKWIAHVHFKFQTAICTAQTNFISHLFISTCCLMQKSPPGQLSWQSASLLCGTSMVRAPDRTNTQGLKITEENVLPL